MSKLNSTIIKTSRYLYFYNLNLESKSLLQTLFELIKCYFVEFEIMQLRNSFIIILEPLKSVI